MARATKRDITAFQNHVESCLKQQRSIVERLLEEKKKEIVEFVAEQKKELAEFAESLTHTGETSS